VLLLFTEKLVFGIIVKLLIYRIMYIPTGTLFGCYYPVRKIAKKQSEGVRFC